MYVPFNEISIHNDFADSISYESANQIILNFLSLLKEAQCKKIVEGFITNESIPIDIPIIQNWLNDSKIDYENKIFLRSLVGKYFSSVEAPLTDAKIELNGKVYVSKGAGLAFDRGCDYILSLNTNSIWNKENIFFNFETINENDELITVKKELSQISGIISLQKVALTNRKKSFNTISSGQDLWEQWDSLFPNLIKCDITKHCLYENPERNHIAKIIEQLDTLNTYFSSLQDTFSFAELKKLGINVSDESDTVKQKPNLKKHRCVKLPDGTKEYFFYHAKFFGKFETRLYFLPIKNTKKCYIGYIGKHLKTQKY
ncbi:MAG: hypothetical protein HDR32_08280 [Treponema sp.]|nr:hypothetical protein [Treponema sp.]